MPPQLALLLTIGFCVFMMRRISQENNGNSSALWLPTIWIFFIGSRFPTQWLDLFGIYLGSGGAVEDGSPLDALFFLGLIGAGCLALRRRRFSLSSIAKENVWIAVFFVYGFLAIVWSDFPFVALKRWIKTLGHPVMALIVLTDPNPVLAFRTLMKRCSSIMLPLSVLFIKYYPGYGRGFDSWTGQAVNNGIYLSKNELGCACFIFGIFYCWSFISSRKIVDRSTRHAEIWINTGFLLVVGWLLQMAHSATSLSTLILGAGVTLGLGFSFVSKRYFGMQVITIIVLAVAAELSFGVYAQTLELLGRNASLTDRTEVWADALALVDSPILGAGFESFWLGERLEQMWNKWWWQPNQAHNGYIETYLNLGAVGLILFLAVILSTFQKISAKFIDDFEFARFRMGLLLAIILYNYTEATFKALSVLWTIFYIIALEVTRSRQSQSESELQIDRP